jgi:tyrosyl-tRNA synthetase
MRIGELTRNSVDVLPAGALERKLALGRPLRVKLGIDPTAPDLHLGHTVVLDKLADFQREGHQIILIVGDYTARIGDPSGRSRERPVLSDEELDANAKTYAEQAFKVLDRSKTELRHNSEWLAELSYGEIVRISRVATVARLLERDDFAKRFAAGEPISVSEFLYPLMQGYDSVAIEADVELGGTEQLYNLLMGREIMEAYELEPQVVMTVPILSGTDGFERMSKSRGNYVGITEAPAEMFGKVMSIPDFPALPEWWRLLIGEEPPSKSPMESKLGLARRIVTRWHGEEAARLAEEHFTRVVREGQPPEDVLEVPLPDGDPVHLPALLAAAFGLTTSEARRLIEQGGVRLNGSVARGLDVPRDRLVGALIQAGKRRFARLTAP